MQHARGCGRTRTVGERESTEEGSNPSVVPPVYPLEPGSSAGTEREPPIVRYSPEYRFGDAIRPRGIPMPPSTNTGLTGTVTGGEQRQSRDRPIHVAYQTEPTPGTGLTHGFKPQVQAAVLPPQHPAFSP